MSALKMEKAEEALRLAIAFVDRFNSRDARAVGELLHPDCVFEAAAPAPLGSRHSGKAAATAAIGEFFIALPGLRMETEEIYGMGRRAVLRWRLTGIPGAEGGRRGVDLFTVRDGFIIELFAYAKG
jgi:hypothetical protein